MVPFRGFQLDCTAHDMRKKFGINFDQFVRRQSNTRYWVMVLSAASVFFWGKKQFFTLVYNSIGNSLKKWQWRHWSILWTCLWGAEAHRPTRDCCWVLMQCHTPKHSGTGTKSMVRIVLFQKEQSIGPS